MGFYEYYDIPPDHPSLFPDEGFGIVLMDETKDPRSEDFINMVAQMAEGDFNLPPKKPGYTRRDG